MRYIFGNYKSCSKQLVGRRINHKGNLKIKTEL